MAWFSNQYLYPPSFIVQKPGATKMEHCPPSLCSDDIPMLFNFWVLPGITFPARNFKRDIHVSDVTSFP